MPAPPSLGRSQGDRGSAGRSGAPAPDRCVAGLAAVQNSALKPKRKVGFVILTHGIVMADNLIVPPTIEAVIQRFDASETHFSEFDVSRDVNAARGVLQEPNAAENLGAWSEVL